MMKRFFAVVMALALLTAAAAWAEGGDEWVCPNCGTANSGKFCEECGQPRPAALLCPQCAREYPWAAETNFCAFCGASLKGNAPAAAASSEGPGFASPEDAAAAFLSGLKAQDLEQMAQTFACETRMLRSDLAKTIGRISNWSLTVYPAFVRGNQLLDALDAAYARELNLRTIRYTMLTLINPELELSQPVAFPRDSESDQAAFLASFDQSRLAALETIDNIRFLTPQEAVSQGYLPESFLSERNQENIEKLRAAAGMDQWEDRLALFDMGGQTYAFAPTLARYGDAWYIYQANGMIATFWGINPYTCIWPVE